MSHVNIFRYRSQYMKAELFSNIARDLRLDGEFTRGDEGMVLTNGDQILTWSQPRARFAGLLFYLDRSRSLAEPAEELPDVDAIKEHMNGFLERYRLTPIRGEHDVSVKLEARVTEAKVERDKEMTRSLPMRVDVSSRIELDDLPVFGPRAKIRAAFSGGRRPQFLHIGLWETVEVLKTGELIARERLNEIIDDRVRRRREEPELHVRDITLAYWAHEYRGGADVLEPYYFVEIEHLEEEARKGEYGSGPRHVIPFLAYT